MFTRAGRIIRNGRCQGIAAGCICTYSATDFQRWNAQMKRTARQDDIREELRHRRADLLQQFHDFKVALRREGAIQAATDTGKLALGVIPGGTLLGQSLDTLNDANNLHDFFLILNEVKDITDLGGDEETAVLKVLARNTDGEVVVKSLLEIEALESELKALGSPVWVDHCWGMAWAWMHTMYRQRMQTSGVEEHDSEYVKIFRVMDKDEDGVINKVEFERALKIMDGSWKELATVKGHAFYVKADVDGDGEVNLDDFLAWIKTTEKLVKWFHAMDANNDGLIDEPQFQELLRKANESMPDLHLVNDNFKSIDIDRDGQINIPEFVGWVQGTEMGFRDTCIRIIHELHDHGRHFGSKLVSDMPQGVMASLQQKVPSSSNVYSDVANQGNLAAIIEKTRQLSVPSFDEMKQSINGFVSRGSGYVAAGSDATNDTNTSRDR